MGSLFVDTNIVLDLLQKREGYFREAQELFSLADKKEIKLCVSSLTIANTHFLLTRFYNSLDARRILTKFKVLVEVLALDDKIIELALASDFKDFEDAIQYHTALEHDSQIILTRNKKDFKTSKIPVLTAKEYLSRK
jgi:predicted nucleic acid-binding protein